MPDDVRLDALTREEAQDVKNIVHTESIHPYRWRAITVWIILFTAIVIYTTHKADDAANANNDTIRDLIATKASLHQLEHTNCGLKIFLLTARRVRYDAVHSGESPIQRKADRAAMDGYKDLADKFLAIDDCKIPARLILPQDKKG